MWLSILLVDGGDLSRKQKSLSRRRGPYPISFVISDLMGPVRVGFATFAEQVGGRSQSQFSRATLHDYLPYTI